jgi:hypothetical protein
MTSSKFIKDHKGKICQLKHKTTCQTTSVIYVIACKSCNIRYVGQTTRPVHERLISHRSDINNNSKTTLVSEHFNNDICGGIDSLTITPVEIVPIKSPGEIIPMKELLARLEREQFWINKLKTIAPHGLNKQNELPPAIPFIPKFSDQAGKLARLANTSFHKIRNNLPGPFYRARFLSANSRNKNLKDLLVRTALK